MAQELATRCCIAGGGPAGLMLGLLLARAGVDVVVLEKHADFLRDFRGDTIHPSTMEAIADLGWLEEFLALPHEKVPRLAVRFGETSVPFVDFARLPVRARFIAMMPQWDFLDFLARKAAAFPGFRLIMRAEAVDLRLRDDRVVGVEARTPDGPLAVAADLVVAADGRGSVLRARSGLAVDDLGAPMDVLWFRLPRRPDDTTQTQGRFDAGRIFVMLNRGDYWQCAFVIPKGSDAQVRAAGLPAFRAALAPLLPFEAARADDLTDWDRVKLLTVRVDRLWRWWRPGLLCIGDAAHAMSPIGGVGVNLAVQDAIAAANILGPVLRRGVPADADLAAVQARRERATRVTQRLQLLAQDRIIAPTLARGGRIDPPWLLRVLPRVPILRDLPARLIGLGWQPERPARIES